MAAAQKEDCRQQQMTTDDKGVGGGVFDKISSLTNYAGTQVDTRDKRRDDVDTILTHKQVDLVNP